MSAAPGKLGFRPKIKGERTPPKIFNLPQKGPRTPKCNGRDFGAPYFPPGLGKNFGTPTPKVLTFPEKKASWLTKRPKGFQATKFPPVPQ